MEQRIAVLVSLILGALVIGTFVVVARSAPQTGSPEEITAAAARWRRTLFWGLVILFVPVIAYSFTKMPYSSGDGPAAVVIQATGHQWAWEMTPATVPAGQRVEIHVTGTDVNHGFGIFDANNRLITQAQAMPGFTNVIRTTFASPGTYRIMCLEYCGLGHHTMFAQLVVTPTSAQ